MRLNITWDRAYLERVVGPNGLRALTRAVSKAGGDAIRATKVEGGRVVRARKRLKVRRVKAAMPLRFPRSTRELTDLEWRMPVSGDVVPVAEYPLRQTRQGISVEINAGRRTLIKSAFLATMKSRHRGVYRRRGDKRLPIDELFTTRVSDVFLDAGMIPGVNARAQTVFRATLGRVLPMELEKLRR